MTSRQSGHRGRPPQAGSAPAAIIEVAIFDLDDTLYDCYGQRVLVAHRHASQAMADAGVPASADEILRVRMQAFRDDPHLEHIDAEVCRIFAVADPAPVMQRAREAYFSAPVGALKLFPGSRRLLRTLRKRGVRIFVVSFGDPQTQRAKIAALGLDREPAVEHIFYADTDLNLTKDSAFSSILQRTGAQPANVLVVGDRPGGEIRAGRRLGMHTVRLRHGEFAVVDPQNADEQADFEIFRIEDVPQLPFRFGKRPWSRDRHRSPG